MNGSLTAEAHAQVSTAPEKIGHGTTTCDVAAQPADVCNRTLLSDVRQTSLVGILEGTNLLGSAQLLLAFADLIENLVALLGALGLCLSLRQLLQVILDGLGLSHSVEETSKESTLLTSNLSSGGIVGDSAVTDGPNVLGTVDDQVFVNSETTARVLLGGKLAHKVPDNRADGVTGGPNQETVRDGFQFLGSVGLSDLSLDVLIGHVLDHGLGADGDSFLLEGRLGVVNKLLGEHGKHVGKSLNKGDLEVLLDLRNPLLEILLEEVLDLTSELNTSGATTDDNHVQKTLDLILSLILEDSGLDTVHDTRTDLLGISDLLQEARVLLDTLDAY